MEILTWALGAITVVSFLGTAAVFLRGSKDKGTIATLTNSNTALTENNRILNDRVTLLEASDTAKGEKLRAQEHTIEVLTNTVNSSALIGELKVEMLRAIAGHHTQAMDGIKQLHGDLDTLPRRLAVVLKNGGAK